MAWIIGAVRAVAVQPMKNVQDIYPLSPMQEFMLLHALAHRSEDVLLNQSCFRIDGPLDASALQRAWQAVTDRHAALRTAFVWEGLKRPMQIVRERASPDFERIAPSAAAGTVEDILRADRERGFDPTQAPLSRLKLLHLDAASHLLVWTSHHLIVDRWCLATLFGELAACYEALVEDRAPVLMPVRPFRDYIAWVERQDAGEAERFWRGALAGLPGPAHIAGATPAVPGDDAERTLSPETAGRVRAAARRFAVTPGVLLQAAWAQAIYRTTGAQDVVFGLTVAGRPPEIDGIETMMGSFVNNVPVRFRLSREGEVATLLRDAQGLQNRRARYEYLAPPRMESCADLEGTAGLFDSLFVWLAADPGLGMRGLDVSVVPGMLRTAYPLTLSVAEQGDTLGFTLSASRAPESVSTEGLLDALIASIDALTGCAADTRLGTLPGLSGLEILPALSVEPSRPVERQSVSADAVGPAGGRETMPREIFEELLGSEWEDVLERADIGPDDDFFALGGDSLRAARLHARIVTVTRRAIPLLSLFAKPTVKAMAEALSAQQWPQNPSIVVPVRSKGTAVPLFCVASPEVNTIGYGMLARHLDRGQPVYVLQAPPDSDAVRRLSPRELPRLAARYVDAMTDVQPEGPYRLLGMCTGAQLSLEMARVLEARGERAAFVGIVNTWAFYTVSRLVHVHRLRNRLKWYRRRVREAFAGGVRAGFGEVARVLARRVGLAEAAAVPAMGAARAAIAPPSLPPSPDDELDGAGDEWLVEFGQATRSPASPPVAATVTVLRIGPQPFWRIRDRGLGWGKHAARVDVVDLSTADHHAILREPSVREVAGHIGAALSRTVA